MTGPFDPLRALRVLAARGVDFIVVGQMAAVIHGHPESTVDLDVLVRQDIDNAERLVAALRELQAHPVGADGQQVARPLDERDFLGWTQIVETNTSAGPLDVLPYAIGVGGYDDLLPRAARVQLDDVEVWVASLDDIIASKSAAGRPKDLRRLPSLREFARRRANEP